MSAEAHRIVVGLDGSARAKGVLAAAVTMARAFHAELILVRAVGIPVDFPIEARATPPLDLAKSLEEIARHDLTRMAAEVPPEIPTSRRTHLGVPWEAIVEEAASAKAELIVIGSHGYQGLDRLLGTTAAKVVNHAPCSTLVVR
jgi:nucleotide-binding universal stress UspA family protein